MFTGKKFYPAQRCILAAFLVIFLTAFLSACQGKDIQPVGPEFTNQQDIGVWGPVQLDFSDEAAIDQQETFKVVFHPELPYTEKWIGNTLYLWFQKPANLETQYELRLEVPNEDFKEESPAYTWEFQVRDPKVIFLEQREEGAEIWVSAIDGTNSSQITQTSYGIMEYAVSPGGNEIVFTVLNREGGTDLWMVDRNGENMHQLVSCEAARCSEPVYSPYQEGFYYFLKAGPMENPPSDSEIRYFDFSEQSSLSLRTETESQLIDLKISQDGKWLVYLAGESGRLHLYNTGSREETPMPCWASNSGSFSPDHERLVVACLVEEASDPCKPLEEINLETLEMSLSPLHALLERRDYSAVSWSYDEKWVVFGERCLNQTPTKQLWLVEMDDLDTRPLTSDIRYNHADYHWDPNSSMILFQRLEMGSSVSAPEILLWELESNETLIVVAGARSPNWLP